MGISEAELFRKKVVSRPPATSILSSLLSSPKTTCSSPDFASPSDCFSECDLTSRTDGPSPPTRTRRSCLSFAAAPSNSPPTLNKPPVSKSDIEGLVRSQFPKPCRTSSSPVNIHDIVVNHQHVSIRPIIGSVFDEFGEDKSSPVFHDYYRVGQPKKLVDDCLKKEKELRIMPTQEDEDRDFEEDDAGSASDKDEDEDEEEDVDHEDEYDNEDESLMKSVNNYRALGETVDLSTPVRLLPINIPVSNGALLAPAVYTPSRDIVDNFVPGTLDEDHIEAFRGRSPKSPHDIDPTYPSDGEEEGDEQPQQARFLNSPVRFIPEKKRSTPRPPAHTVCQLPAAGLNRIHSLPWGRRGYINHIKPPVTKRALIAQPRCSAIAITKSIEHKRHHRRGKREDVDQSNEMKGVGAAAMAAMARQLTSNHTMVGVWALSV